MSGAREARSRIVYERLLAAYPKRFRELYGEEMVGVFEDEYLEQAQGGGLGRLLWFWCRVISDLLGNAVLERKRCAMGFSMVKWGGLLAAAGGFLLMVSAVHLFLRGALGNEPPGVVLIGYLAGSLLITGGPLGLVALIARRGNSDDHSVRRLGNSGNSRLTWMERFAAIGFIMAVLAVPSTLWILATNLQHIFFIGGYELPLPQSVLTILFFMAAILSGLGLPAATILLGVVIWRSEFIRGRWRTLPMVAGLLTILAPIIGIAMAHLLSLFVISSDLFGQFLTFGAPQVAVGCVWILLGFILLRHDSTNHNLQLDASIDR